MSGIEPGCVVLLEGHLGRVDHVFPDARLWGSQGAAIVRWSWAPHIQRPEPLCNLSLIDEGAAADEPAATEPEEAEPATEEADEGGTYQVALVQGARDPGVRVVEVTWEKLRQALTTLRVVTCDKLEAPGWMPVVMLPGAPLRRANRNVSGVWALVADLDSGNPASTAIEAARQGGFRAIWHTSWSHSPECTKGRLVLPFDEPCPAERWREVWQAGSRWAASVGLEVDKRAKDPARLYFLPALPAGEPERQAWFHAEVIEGRPMRWRWLLAHHAPPPAPTYQPRAVPLASAGPASTAEAERRRLGRQKAALGILQHRCRRIASMGDGAGRNSALYGAGRTMTPMIEAGDIDRITVMGELVAAGVAAGLSESEAATAASNGIRRGAGEPNILDNEAKQ